MKVFRSKPAAQPVPGDPEIELTAAGVDVLWQARADEAHRICAAALQKYGSGRVPADVLLDVMIALHPPKPLRPAVPVIPGPAPLPSRNPLSGA